MPIPISLNITTAEPLSHNDLIRLLHDLNKDDDFQLRLINDKLAALVVAVATLSTTIAPLDARLTHLEEMSAAILTAVQSFHPPHPTLKGGSFMFIVKADNPDVSYAITPPEATDSEGDPIPNAQLNFETVSDTPDVVAITTDPANPLAGTVHFGKPGQAAVNVNVRFQGALLGAFGAQFTVTAGDPTAITGGSIAFNGLTES